MRLFFIFYFLTIGVFAQQFKTVNFKTAEVDLSHLHFNGQVGGKVIYTFDVLKDIDSIYIDARNFKHSAVAVDGVEQEHDYNGKQIIIKKTFKANTSHELLITWVTYPKKAMYFVGWDNSHFESLSGRNQIWTQGQGKYTSHWLPSFDDMNEKVEFDLKITFDKNYRVLANGKLKNKEVKDDAIVWHYDMQHPMPSYLLALAIGDYDVTTKISDSGIPLEMYYYPKDSAKAEPTYRYTKRMFDYLEGEIGVPYPWQNYKQVPVHDFLYAGMENTSLTIFSDMFMTDNKGFDDKNYVNVNAHELAHQWFGDMVTATHSKHHWLQEGFATYYALLAERDVFGSDYFYWRLFEYAEELRQQDLSGNGTALLNPKASSTTFYKRGAWALHRLRELVGGEVFREAVKNYLNAHRFKNVETSDFLDEVERLSEVNLTTFKTKWLMDKTFPIEDAMESVKRSTFIQEYLQVDCEAPNSKCTDYMNGYLSDEAKAKLIKQVPTLVNKEVFNNSVKVRQALAEVILALPENLKPEAESLLQDQSYVTNELALINLWKRYPEQRPQYLNATKTIEGMSDKNVRLLWLTLALLTEDYNADAKPTYYNELVEYTSPVYNFEIRQAAFSYLQTLDAFNEIALSNLKEASKHHNWRMKSFAKNALKVLSENPKYKTILKKL